MNKIIEIVNNKIDVTKDTIILYYLLLEKLDKEETAYKMSKENFIDAQEELKFLIKIKGYLEILEILRKYLYLEQQCYDYDWEDGGFWIDYLDIKDIDDIDEHYTEDFKKIKQWLEENE